ncbi:DMT family transporter [Streptomyces sp. 8N706]|uniref:DMT family transporter n=1 Tax=Streptomyces sp. 8N706 TaxID=3457416 RepID=UPI003FD57DF2
MSSLTPPVLLSLASAVCYGAAAIVQERVATAVTSRRRTALLRHRAWWSAVALNGAGAALHVVALGCGPLTLVQPLGVLTIVFVLPMAAVCVGRQVTSAGWRGALMVSVGLAGILLLTGPAEQSQPLSGNERLGVAACAAGAIAVLVPAGRRARRPGVRSVALAGAAGVSFGVSSVFVKTVAEDWSPASVAGQLPSMGMIALLAATGLAASQASYRGGGLTAPLATVTVVNPVVAAGVGMVVLDEGFRFGVAGALTALAAGVLTAWGLVVLTADGARRHRQPAPADGPAVVRVPCPDPVLREDRPALLAAS